MGKTGGLVLLAVDMAKHQHSKQCQSAMRRNNKVPQSISLEVSPLNYWGKLQLKGNPVAWPAVATSPESRYLKQLAFLLINLFF